MNSAIILGSKGILDAAEAIQAVRDGQKHLLQCGDCLLETRYLARLKDEGSRHQGKQLVGGLRSRIVGIPEGSFFD